MAADAQKASSELDEAQFMLLIASLLEDYPEAEIGIAYEEKDGKVSVQFTVGNLPPQVMPELVCLS